MYPRPVIRTLLHRAAVSTLDLVIDRGRASERPPLRRAAELLDRARGVVGLDRIPPREPLPAWDRAHPEQPMWKSDREKLLRHRIDRGIIKPEESAPEPGVAAAAPAPAPVIKIYFRRGCPYSRAAIDLLRERELPFTEIDMTEDRGLQDFVKRLSGRETSPQIVIHERPIGGFDELRELDQSGDLKVMIESPPPPEGAVAEAIIDAVIPGDAPSPAAAKPAAKRVSLPVVHPERSPFEGLELELFGEQAPSERLSGAALTDRVMAVLDEVRPMVQSDGGDIELLDIQDDVVAVRLTGNCIGCPSSQATLRQGIERKLKLKIPQIKGISSPQLQPNG
jgi:Fe-S cluster biogenesis protein NfuA/glutaredoxin